MSKSPLLHSEHELLINWGVQVEKMFTGAAYRGVFHVGSSTYARDYRDVDVRLIIHDNDYKSLSKQIDMEYFRLGISLWGQRATGLPIDFDIQPMSYANKQYPQPEFERHPLGITVSAIHNTVVEPYKEAL